MTVLTAVAPLPADFLTADQWHVTLHPTDGLPVNGAYVRRWWLPVLGPSALALLTTLPEDAQHPMGVNDRTWRPVDLACRLGIGYRGGRASPLIKALERLRQFRIVQTMDADAPTIIVPDHLAPIGTRGEARMTPYVRAEHRQHLRALGQGGHA